MDVPSGICYPAGRPCDPMEGWGLGGGEGKRADYAGVVCSVGPTAKGQDIKHKDLWQEIVLKMAPHLVFMRAGGHSYQLWMQEKLKKMVETPQETR